MPWLQLDGKCLYLSQAENIGAYQLRPDRAGIQRHPHAIFSGHQEDVCRFVLADSHIVSGGGDGNIILHEMHGSYSVKFLAHEQEVNCVDFRGGIIVSGSRDRTAKVWSLSPSRVGQCLHMIQTEDRVWSVAISPLLSSFVTGTACCGHTSPLRIWDLERALLWPHPAHPGLIMRPASSWPGGNHWGSGSLRLVAVTLPSWTRSAPFIQLPVSCRHESQPWLQTKPSRGSPWIQDAAWPFRSHPDAPLTASQCREAVTAAPWASLGFIPTARGKAFFTWPPGAK
uniref:Uncharacterized protein n=1 Tax=Crocodylus porosus TaxID=8502 RepID=A0A7M4F430_CROPO